MATTNIGLVFTPDPAMVPPPPEPYVECALGDITESCTTLVGMESSNAEEPEIQTFIMVATFSVIGVDVEIFVGLEVAPGLALVDTGAQHAVVGPPAFNVLCLLLEKYGLKPRKIPTLQIPATGVGGSASFLWSYEMPIAIKEVCGIQTVHGVPQNIPLLLPVDLCKKLGMILNMPKMHIDWEYIKKSSQVTEIGPGGHLALPIFEFPYKRIQHI